MNEQLHALVEHTMAQGVGARVFALRWKNRRIWIKQAVPAKQKGWHHLQRFLATITGIALLRPTVSPGGKEGLETEANTLRKLSEQGILVPDLVGVAENWIAIGDNGGILQTRIEDYIRAGDHDAVTKLIDAAGKGLAKLHQAGVAHGAPLLRNLTIRDDDKIGFIDFEEDPNERMPIIDAPQMVPLRKIVKVLRPVYLMLRPFRRWLGTDAINGLLAYRILRKSLNHE